MIWKYVKDEMPENLFNGHSGLLLVFDGTDIFLAEYWFNEKRWIEITSSGTNELVFILAWAEIPGVNELSIRQIENIDTMKRTMLNAMTKENIVDG